MKMIRFLPLIILLAAGAVTAQDDEYFGMKGTETPKFQEASETGDCFVFREYVVKTARTDAGQAVAVYKRAASTGAQRACQTTEKPYFDIADFEVYSFFGLAGTHLFIDSGTSYTDAHGLAIYSLATREQVFAESYIGDPRLTEGRYMAFDSPSDKKGPLKACKQAAKWKRDGGRVGWAQGKKLDLQTMKTINVGTLRCYQE